MMILKIAFAAIMICDFIFTLCDDERKSGEMLWAFLRFLMFILLVINYKFF